MREKAYFLFPLFLLLLPMKIMAQWDRIEPERIVIQEQPKLLPPKENKISGIVVSQTSGKPVTGASVSLVGTDVSVATDKSGRFSLSCPEGKNMLRITHTEMKPLEMEASNNMRVVMVSKNPHIDDKPFSCFYLQPSLQVGSLMGVGAAVGGYISDFNVEAFFTMGLAKSEDIYWTKSGSSTVTCSYKPSTFGLRIGYGFTVGTSPVSDRRLRLTPQAGIAAVSIKCNDGDSKGYATSATLGLRAEYALSRNVALFATPEASFAVSKSEIYQQLMDVSSKIKGWGTGFNARLGVSVIF